MIAQDTNDQFKSKLLKTALGGAVNVEVHNLGYGANSLEVLNDSTLVFKTSFSDVAVSLKRPYKFNVNTEVISSFGTELSIWHVYNDTFQLGSKVYFSGGQSSSGYGHELYYHDGTTTTLVDNPEGPNSGSKPRYFKSYTYNGLNYIVFTAEINNDGHRNLFLLEDTPGATPVNISTLYNSGNAITKPFIDAFLPINGTSKIIHTAKINENQYELWVTDLLAQTATKLTDYNSDATNYTRIGSYVYFMGNSEDNNQQIAISRLNIFDNTISQVVPSNYFWGISPFRKINDKIYCSVSEGLTPTTNSIKRIAVIEGLTMDIITDSNMIVHGARYFYEYGNWVYMEVPLTSQYTTAGLYRYNYENNISEKIGDQNLGLEPIFKYENYLFLRSLGSTKGLYRYLDETLTTNDFISAQFNIYPNPVNQEFKIESTHKGIKQVEIYNLHGEKVKTFILSNNYNISDLSSGMYILKTISDSGVAIKKLIKE